MFVNCSNHPSTLWNEAQLKAAREYGEIKDYPFPNVLPTLSTAEVAEFANKVSEEIISWNPSVVMCQGEFTLAYHVVRILKEHNIQVIAACTERRVRESKTEDGKVVKTAEFDFVQFRAY